jgi:hypothetical protein
MASYQTVPSTADEPLLQKPKQTSGKYIMAVAFVATFAIGMLAGSLAVTTSEVKSTGPMEMKKWCKGIRIDDDTDCDDIDEGGDYSYSYSGPGVLCPGLDKDDFCDCDGDCTENPDWCSCSQARNCCS